MGIEQTDTIIKVELTRLDKDKPDFETLPVLDIIGVLHVHVYESTFN